MRKNSTTGIVMATKIEAEPFIKGLRMAMIKKGPKPIFGNSEFFLTVSGIGKVNAAIATTHLIDAHHPSVVINIGAAGAADNECEIGHIAHISKIIELDRYRYPILKPVEHKPDLLKGFSTATLATRDRAVLSAKDRLQAGRIADLFDMEGAAVVQACRAFNTRVYLFKIITDNMKTGNINIIKNILHTRNSLFMFLIEKIMPAVLPGR
jgi:nucleoside phosphorylase